MREIVSAALVSSVAVFGIGIFSYFADGVRAGLISAGLAAFAGMLALVLRANL